MRHGAAWQERLSIGIIQCIWHNESIGLSTTPPSYNFAYHIAYDVIPLDGPSPLIDRQRDLPLLNRFPAGSPDNKLAMPV